MTGRAADLDRDLAAILRAGEARTVRFRLWAGIATAILALALLGGLLVLLRPARPAPAPRITAAKVRPGTNRPATATERRAALRA